MQRADGIYRWFQCNGLPLRDAHGQVLRWYNLLTDIEDGKEAETRVRAREKELELIVNTLPACVWGRLGGRCGAVRERPLQPNSQVPW